MKTSENIKKIRHELCVSQIEFADMLGLGKSSVCLYEQGYRKPSFKTVRKIIEVAKKHGIKIKLEDIRDD
jgi:DNA-binding transcriptional regulator YiaG